MPFEKIAVSLKWSEEIWIVLLQSVLIGKAREIYSALPIEQSARYTVVKESILKAYELVPKVCRQKFRSTSKRNKQTFVEFARDKELVFDRWCASQNVDGDFANLRQLLLVEEFKNCLSNEVKTYLDEHEAETLQQAAVLADEYTLTHQRVFSPKLEVADPKSHPPPPSRNSNGLGQGQGSRYYLRNQDQGDSTNKGNRLCSGPTCHYCKRKGHIMSECQALEKKEKTQKTDLVVTKSDLQKSQSPLTGQKSEDNDFKPFISEGRVSLVGMDASNGINILRDTGASQSLLVKDVLPLNEQSFMGSSVLIQGIKSGVACVPLHVVDLQSSLVSGPVMVGIGASLSVQGVSLILGNDLAGDRVMADPCVSPKPCLSVVSDDCSNEMSEVFPVCAVTRAMAKQNHIEKSTMAPTSSIDSAMPCNRQQPPEISCKSVGNESCVTPATGPPLTRKQLIYDQQADPELRAIVQHAGEEHEVRDSPVSYFIKGGVLMRKWRSPIVPSSDEWETTYQIVEPQNCRAEVMKLARSSPLAGHLGVGKTCSRILSHFYWPGIRSYVRKFCRECHVCQVVGNPNQKNPIAPLKPIPAFTEPFSRVMIDCVGPLPKSKAGNQYLLTVMCTLTRYPEAVPLRNIKAKTIVKALVKFFTLFGLPQAIQSDQGSCLVFSSKYCTSWKFSSLSPVPIIHNFREL